MENKDLRAMVERWPSTVVARSEVKKFTGGALSGKTLANADCYGSGPKGRFKLGRSTVYPVKSLIVWLEDQAKSISDCRCSDQGLGKDGGQNEK